MQRRRCTCFGISLYCVSETLAPFTALHTYQSSSCLCLSHELLGFNISLSEVDMPVFDSESTDVTVAVEPLGKGQLVNKDEGGI